MPKPSKQAVEAEKQLEELERQTNEELQKEQSKSKGESETPQPESAPGEQTTQKEEPTTTPKPEGQPGKEETEELSDEEVQQLSKKAQKRFQKLSVTAKENVDLKKRIADLEKKHATPAKPDEEKEEETTVEDEDLESEIETAEEELGESSKPGTGKSPKKGKLPWESEKGEGEEETKEITEEDYAKDVEAKAEAKVKEVMRQRTEKRLSNLLFRRFKSDVKRVEAEYDILNPESENYDETLVNNLATTYKGIFKADRKTSFYRFIKHQMALLEKGKEIGKTQGKKSIEKQEGEQAIAPTGEAGKKPTGIEQKIEKAQSIEDLEALEGEIHA